MFWSMVFFFISIVGKSRKKQAYKFSNWSWRVIFLNWEDKQYKIR